MMRYQCKHAQVFLDYMGTSSLLSSSKSSKSHYFNLSRLQSGYSERCRGKKRESEVVVLDVRGRRQRVEVRLDRQLVEVTTLNHLCNSTKTVY